MSDSKAEYLPVYLEVISADEVNEFDLYMENAGTLRLFRHQSVPITQEDIKSLVGKNHVKLFVPASQKDQFYDHMVRKLPTMLQDGSIPSGIKLELLTETSSNVFERVLAEPLSISGLQGTVTQCKNHVNLALQKNSEEKFLTDGRPEVTPPVAHALNVANLAILLGLRCGIDEPVQLHCLGVGAVLHEIGKRLIDKNYYLRPGKNTCISNMRFKKYPIIGSTMLEESNVVPTGALRPVMEHRERLDGTGFPNQLKASQISIEGRIVAICDYYDETIYANSTRAKETPNQVLMKMTSSTDKFDKHILVEFTHLLGNNLIEDRNRVMASSV